MAEGFFERSIVGCLFIGVGNMFSYFGGWGMKRWVEVLNKPTNLYEK